MFVTQKNSPISSEEEDKKNKNRQLDNRQFLVN
jgi:hypothetical protein